MLFVVVNSERLAQLCHWNLQMTEEGSSQDKNTDHCWNDRSLQRMIDKTQLSPHLKPPSANNPRVIHRRWWVVFRVFCLFGLRTREDGQGALCSIHRSRHGRFTEKAAAYKIARDSAASVSQRSTTRSLFLFGRPIRAYPSGLTWWMRDRHLRVAQSIEGLHRNHCLIQKFHNHPWPFTDVKDCIWQFCLKVGHHWKPTVSQSNLWCTDTMEREKHPRLLSLPLLLHL